VPRPPERVKSLKQTNGSSRRDAARVMLVKKGEKGCFLPRTFDGLDVISRCLSMRDDWTGLWTLKILGLSFQEDPAFRCGVLMLASLHIGHQLCIGKA
jgi:hypothetical protein